MLSARLQGHTAGFTALNRRPLSIELGSVLKTRCRECRAAPAAIAVAGLNPSLITPYRSQLKCRAQERDIGGYTPASYISFSNDPSKQCHHRAEVVVDAPIDVCFAMWNDWTKLVDFLDLIGQIGLDNNTPEMALFQCFYRWRKLPVLEIVFLLERTKVQPNSSVAFRSVYGMPLAGNVSLQEQVDGRTKVQLYFTHPVPKLLVQMSVGPFGVETHMMQILKDNLAAYKAKVEELAPADWQQAKQQAATRAQQQQQQQAKQSPPDQQQATPQRQRTQQQAQQPPEQQQQLQEPQPPAAPAGRKQRTSRRTSAAGEDAAAAAAAASKPRSRSRTSRRTASVAAAADAAAAAGSSSSSGAASRRRTRTATGSAAAAAESGNGTGQHVEGAAKPARRSTTSRRSSSAREQ